LSTNLSPFAPTRPIQTNDQSPNILPFGSAWRRFVAYIVDDFLVSLVGTGIGAIFFNKLWELGLWGRLVGFFVASLYFASLDCGIGGGQTLGKRLMKLRVVDAQGNFVPFWKSLARFTVFAVPSFLFGLTLPETRTPWIVSSLIFVIVLWVGGLTLYLITFNDHARQGLHDLAVGSYVLYYDHSGPVIAKPILQLHRQLIVVLLLVVTGSAAAINNWYEKLPLHLEFRRDAQPIEVMDGVQRARFGERLSHDPAGGVVKKILYVSIIRKSKPLSEEGFADEVARTVLQGDRNAIDYDELSIRLFYGYDIGITSRWNHREFAHTPAEWQQRVLGKQPGRP
jgi:uncharacterized RDD family membrane protein YckC